MEVKRGYGTRLLNVTDSHFLHNLQMLYKCYFHIVYICYIFLITLDFLLRTQKPRFVLAHVAGLGLRMDTAHLIKMFRL